MGALQRVRPDGFLKRIWRRVHPIGVLSKILEQLRLNVSLEKKYELMLLIEVKTAVKKLEQARKMFFRQKMLRGERELLAIYGKRKKDLFISLLTDAYNEVINVQLKVKEIETLAEEVEVLIKSHREAISELSGSEEKIKVFSKEEEETLAFSKSAGDQLAKIIKGLDHIRNFKWTRMLFLNIRKKSMSDVLQVPTDSFGAGIDDLDQLNSEAERFILILKDFKHFEERVKALLKIKLSSEALGLRY